MSKELNEFVLVMLDNCFTLKKSEKGKTKKLYNAQCYMRKSDNEIQKCMDL